MSAKHRVSLEKKQRQDRDRERRGRKVADRRMWQEKVAERRPVEITDTVARG